MSKLNTRYQILKEIFKDVFFREHKNEVVVFCPKKCKLTKKKLEINVAKNTFHCWVCNYSGRIFTLLREYASENQKNRYYETLDFTPIENFEKIVVRLPDEYRFLLDCKETSEGMIALGFLRDLNIGYKTILQNKIGICLEGKYRDRLVFPSFDVDGNINFFSTRSLKENDVYKNLHCEVNRNTIVFNEIFLNWRQPIIIVEDIKSYLKFFEIKNIVPIMGSTLSQRHRLFQEIILNDCPTVYMALDREAKSKSFDFMDRLYRFGVDVRMVDLCPYSQPDEIDLPSTFWRMVQTAKPFDKDEYFERKIMEI